eukprot:comp23374_c0_seq1/m.38674 comp23374_c0_seq1/g.38674  ORF comp23374_c0_seq1/g.38674 comp23374_c0_seq1/m.38674 type:complete len:510 (-) comp23374_c0_seq1:434-1963(-)
MMLRKRKEKQEPTENLALKRKGSAADEEGNAAKRRALETSSPVHIGPVVVRQMELKDAAAVFHMGEKEYSSFQQLYRTWDEYEVVDLLASDPEFCMVAEMEGEDGKPQLVGFVLSSLTEKRKKDMSCGFLGWVAVLSPYQRHHIGTKMVARVLELFQAEGINTVIVDTPAKNHAAKAFLISMGFGEPREHVYMSLNIEKQAEKEAEAELSVSKSRARRPISPMPRRINTPKPGRDSPAAPKKDEQKKDEPKSGPVKIREMEIDDLHRVYELGESVYDANLFPSLYRIWSEHEVVEWFVGDKENCLVAEMDKKVVGFCLGNVIEKKRSAWRYGYLVWMGIDASTQGTGIGKKLFTAFHDLMVERGVRIIVCDTQADNVPARRFFEKQGFGNIELHLYYQMRLGAPPASAPPAQPIAPSETHPAPANTHTDEDGMVVVHVPHAAQRRMSIKHKLTLAHAMVGGTGCVSGISGGSDGDASRAESPATAPGSVDADDEKKDSEDVVMTVEKTE